MLFRSLLTESFAALRGPRLRSTDLDHRLAKACSIRMQTGTSKYTNAIYGGYISKMYLVRLEQDQQVL